MSILFYFIGFNFINPNISLKVSILKKNELGKKRPYFKIY